MVKVNTISGLPQPGPGPGCTGYTDAQLTQEEKSRLLARLNRRRNEAASGQLRAMPSAGDMLKLVRLGILKVGS